MVIIDLRQNLNMQFKILLNNEIYMDLIFIVL